MTDRPINSEPIKPPFTAKITHALLDRPLTGPSYSATYPPNRMPFYLYSGSSSSSSSTPEYHIDHALLRGPNIQLSASNITLSLPVPSSSSPLLLTLSSVHEAALQPFPTSNATLAAQPSFFFTAGAKLAVSVWRDPVARTENDGDKILGAWAELGEGDLVGEGTVTLGENIWVDAEEINQDPDIVVDKEDKWKKEFDWYFKGVGVMIQDKYRPKL